MVLAVRERGLVHSDYLKGLLRVSCRYCPYKGLAELLVELREGPDPGLIEAVLRREWSRWYRDHVPYEAFVSERLRRYVPRVARMFYLAKRGLAKGEPELGPEDAAKLHSSVWTAPLEALRRTPVVPLRTG